MKETVATTRRLLQRKCVSHVLGVKHEDVIIRRTKGRKPFAAGGPPRPHAPNFNYNVSHEVRITRALEIQVKGALPFPEPRNMIAGGAC